MTQASRGQPEKPTRGQFSMSPIQLHASPVTFYLDHASSQKYSPADTLTHWPLSRHQI